MRKFEYKAVPAPNTGTKAKGVKTTEDRFALSVTEALNEMAEDGWEYVRSETLPCTERKGLTGSQQTYQNVLIFRRLEQAALPLDRTTSRPVQAFAEPMRDEPVDMDAEPIRREPVVVDAEALPEEPFIVEAEPANDAPRLSSRPPVEGAAPTVRALDD